MNSCLVILNHTLRINSKIFREALKSHNVITVVYVSPWYNKKEERKIIKTGDQTFYKMCINHFAYELQNKLDIPLHLLKSEEPWEDIKLLMTEREFTSIYYDMPLFGSLNMSLSEDVIIVDSDSYDPNCTKMTAKSRWVHWSKNKKNNIIRDPQVKICKHFNLNLPVYKPNKEMYIELKEEIDKVFTRLNDIVPLYHKTRNHKEGSTRLSKYLHHGVIDAAKITSSLIAISPDFMTNDHPLVPLLRQLAFREISIRKTRTKNLTMEMPIEKWADVLLDKKSYESLIKEFPAKFTDDQFLSGETGILILDNEINRLKEEKWAPNRIRMWLSSQCYYGLGGGINSLKTLIKLFDMYSDDGQSPNNYISCIETMRLQYGKVMNYNTERTFKLTNKK